MIPGSVAGPVLLGAAVALALTSVACLELVRRPSSAGAEPAWETAAPASVAVDSMAKQSSALAGPTSVPVAAVASVPTVRAVHADRPRHARDRVRVVNEYVYWCLERDLWDEARLHLEQALSVDSLAASLHNNMGIVHEKQGRPQEAVTAYERAWQLRPKDLYGDNLRRLRKRLVAADEPSVPDSLRIEHENGDRAPEHLNREAEADSATVDQKQR